MHSLLYISIDVYYALYKIKLNIRSYFLNIPKSVMYSLQHHYNIISNELVCDMARCMERWLLTNYYMITKHHVACLLHVFHLYYISFTRHHNYTIVTMPCGMDRFFTHNKCIDIILWSWPVMDTYFSRFTFFEIL